MKNKFAFTLAEVMVVITVIGILSAILLPVARNAAPDEARMKFKKANSTLGNVIRELVNNEQYYLAGDLGVKPDGTFVNSAKYFCQTFADVLSTKKVDCSSETKDIDKQHLHLEVKNGVDNTEEQREKADESCKEYPLEEIISVDNVTYYSVSPGHHFAIGYPIGATDRLFGNPGKWSDTAEYDASGNVIASTNNSPFDLIYKVFCIDIDGINNGEDPFGYGIRADGKIFYGKRAQEWLEKSLQAGND